MWIFENSENGNVVVTDGDVSHTAAVAGIGGNVWKYTAEDPDDKDKVAEVASVHKKDVKRFLQHLLMVKHFRVEGESWVDDDDLSLIFHFDRKKWSLVFRQLPSVFLSVSKFGSIIIRLEVDIFMDPSN